MAETFGDQIGSQEGRPRDPWQGGSMQRTFCAFSLIFLLYSPIAAADEIIQLLDKTKIVGQIVHYYDGLLNVKLPNGTVMQLPANKVQQILFKLPPPRKELSTPAKSFERLRKAALKGDLQTYVDCHSAYYQMFLNHQIGMGTPEQFASRLKKEWGDVQLEVTGTTVKGDSAVMKVRRKNEKDKEGQEGELRFVKENNEWKMILPL